MSSNKQFGGHDSFRQVLRLKLDVVAASNGWNGNRRGSDADDVSVIVMTGCVLRVCAWTLVAEPCGTVPGGSPQLTREQVSIRYRAERGGGGWGQWRIIRALGICLTCCLPFSPLPENRGGRERKIFSKSDFFNSCYSW